MEKGTQTDIIIMEFNKAFDKVPHKWLISKVQYYGVQGESVEWIKSFLLGRKQ